MVHTLPIVNEETVFRRASRDARSVQTVREHDEEKRSQKMCFSRDRYINFPYIDEQYINAQIQDGVFHDATELVLHAVRCLRESDRRLNAALELGMQDIREGRTTPFTPALMTDIQNKARQAISSNKKLDPDVCPSI